MSLLLGMWQPIIWAESSADLKGVDILLPGQGVEALERLEKISFQDLSARQKIYYNRLACQAYMDVGRADQALIAGDTESLTVVNGEEGLKLLLCRNRAYQRLGEMKQAEAAINQAEEIAVDLPKASWQPLIFLNRGELLIQLDQTDQAFEVLNKAYNLAKSGNNQGLKNDVLNALATVYYNTGRADLAEAYYTELVQQAELSEEYADLEIALFNLAHAYASQEKFAQADKAFKRALDIAEDIDDQLGAAFSLKAWGESTLAQGGHDSARERFEAARKIFERANEFHQQAIVQRHLGDIAVVQQRYEDALLHYNQAIPVLEHHHSMRPLMRAYRGMSEVYSSLGDHQKAYLIHQAYTMLLKTHLEEQNDKSTKKLQAQFETQRLNERNQILALDNERQQVQLELERRMVIGLSIGVALALVIAGLLLLLWRRRSQYAARMEQLATIDGLTGISNRRTIMERGKTEWNRSDRFKTPLSCLIFDIDHFKSINDTYGHSIGDVVLKGVAMDVSSELRKTDAIGRYGGEEFLVIATETDRDQAGILAERIREAVETTLFDAMPERTVTVSIGVAQLEGEKSLGELIQHADEALYYAKENGRNRVAAFPISR